MQKKQYKVIVIGPTPPPYMGPSIATEIILKSELSSKFALIHLDTSDRRDLSNLGRVDFWNIYLAFKHYTQLLWLIVSKRPSLVYIPISQTTIGYIRDSGFILISKLLYRKVVCHLRGGNFHNWYNSSSVYTRFYIRMIHKAVDIQVILGACLKKMFRGIISEKQVFVIPNGADFSLPQRTTENGLNVVFLANFIRTKGVLDALHASAYVFSESPDIEFHFAGSWRDKETKQEILTFLQQHKDKPISLHGPVSGMKKFDLLALADIFVFPPRGPEGHPWVIVEALAAGLPIISTDQGAITESVFHGVNGFIVKPNSPEQIAEKILYLVKHPDVREKMGRESRRIYEKYFTEEKMVENFTRCFNSVLNNQ